MKKTILFVFIQLVFVILLVSPVLSKIPVPEFYGIYLVANGKLIELKPTKVSFKVNQNGLAQIPSLDIQDSKAYFIVYQRNVNPNKLDLAKLKFLRSKAVDFQATPGFKNPYLDSRKVVNFNIWVLDGIMKFKVAPIEGKEDMYRLVPEHPFAPGVYAVPAGVFGEVQAGLGGFGGYLESMDKKNTYGGVAYGFTVKAGELREELEKEEELVKKEKVDTGVYKKKDLFVDKEKDITSSETITIASLTKGARGANFFSEHSKKFNAEYSTVWNIVLDVLKKLEFGDRKIVESDSEKGVIVTDLDLKLNGFFGPSTYDKYYIIIEKTNEESTTVNFKFLTYSFDKHKRPIKTFVNKKSKKFLELIEKKLIGERRKLK